jgi:predicted dehydrogenase
MIFTKGVVDMIRLAVVGLGKMGLSHYAMINAHPQVKVEAVCDSSSYTLDTLNKYTGVRTYTDFNVLLREVDLDAVIIATPSSMHTGMVRAALDKNLHVFCEKPFCLDYVDSEQLATLADNKGVVNQVGYHCRFIGAFQEVKRLLDVQAIGEVTHVLAEAYGPVVLRPRGTSWRIQRSEGGGCLYDYAAHPLNLLNWYLGEPRAVGGSILNKIFSKDTDDEVFGTLYYEGDKSAQISVNWSDESYRKMTTKITIWGKHGRIFADRQECQVYLRDLSHIPPGYQPGWNVRYTTQLTEPVWFYLRGEEYSAQLDYFIRHIQENRIGENINSFRSAAATDRIISWIIADAAGSSSAGNSETITEVSRKKGFFFGIGRPASSN